MERLTVDTDISFCDIAQCREMPCPYDGACDQRRCYERLREYERTGVTPEGLKRAFNEEAILKLVGQVPRWISVAERLPEDRSNVLVVAYWHERWGVYMGWCAPERAEWSTHVGIGDRDDVTVTHWMPLPEPPKEEDDG